MEDRQRQGVLWGCRPKKRRTSSGTTSWPTAFDSAAGSGGVTEVELARKVECSECRLAKMEAGNPVRDPDLLVGALLAARPRIPIGELARMVALSKGFPAT